MRLIDADRLLTERMKSKYYHLPNGDTAIPLIDIEHAPTVGTGSWLEPHWIPVTKEPKKEEKSYWVCLDGGGQCQCRWTNDVYGLGANEWSKWGWKKVDLPQFSKVLAYMPLPEPYKEATE